MCRQITDVRVILCCLENLRERDISRPYPKPTQVDR